jgi:RNA polymerase sigma-70 factor (ECF subfamily)
MAEPHRRPERAEAPIRLLYPEHGPSVLEKYATRLTGDRTAAEDVVQETLVRARNMPTAWSRARAPCGAGY